MKTIKDLFVYALPHLELAEDFNMAVSCLTAGYRQALWDDVKHFTHDEVLGLLGVDSAVILLGDCEYKLDGEDYEQEPTHFLVYVEA